MEKICYILEEVSRRETPTSARRRQIRKDADKLKRRVEEEAAKRGLEAEVSIQGSVAKDTWLSSDADIDIFVAAPTTVKKEKLATLYMDAARSSVKGLKQTERFADHPYVEAFINETIRLNIVPCYKVQPPNWMSATDRTLYHTKYVQSYLTTENQKREVRILKKFLKGIGVYGADIKTGGFSGYLAELIIIKYRNFQNALKSASNWNYQEIVDMENSWGMASEARHLFDDPLIFIDPVDKYRNVAAAVRLESLSVFQVASKFFLKKPSIAFFYPRHIEPPKPEELIRILNKHKSDFIFLKFRSINTAPDILWGQLYKTEKALKNLLEKFDFKALRSAVWSDEQKDSIIFFQLENAALKEIKKHYGPPASSPEEEKFISKYLQSPKTIAGPYIEKRKWTVIISREYNNAKTLIKEKIEISPVGWGVASKIAQSIKQGYELYLNGEILEFYRNNQEFAYFLTKFLMGKPSWLD